MNVASRVVIRNTLKTGIDELIAIMDGAALPPANGALRLVPKTDFSALGNHHEWVDRLRLENTCPRFIIRGNRMTTRRNTDRVDPRAPYAINRNFPTSKVNAMTATAPWDEGQLAGIFGASALAPDRTRPHEDAITCSYWPWVAPANNAYCCAFPGTRAVPTAVPNANPATWTNTCTTGGFVPEKAVDPEMVQLHV
jgi:hypothetical protein